VLILQPLQRLSSFFVQRPQGCLSGLSGEVALDDVDLRCSASYLYILLLVWRLSASHLLTRHFQPQSITAEH
jgi:hypothetical protein